MAKVTVERAGNLMRLPDVIKSVNLSRNTIYRMISAGEFPPQKKLGRGSIWWQTQIEFYILNSGWNEREWEQWMSEKKKAA